MIQGGVERQDRTPVVSASGSPVVVLGGSTGGVQAVLSVAQGLPAQFPAAVVVNLHRARRDGRDPLLDLLTRRAALPVQAVQATPSLDAGRIHIMPPATALTRTPDGTLGRESVESWRSVDPTMTALAGAYRARCIGVVLSGHLDDGATGVRAVKRAGGRVIVQDPLDAAAPGMPANALATGSVDLVVPLRRVAQTLIALTMAPGGAELLRMPRAPWAS